MEQHNLIIPIFIIFSALFFLTGCGAELPRGNAFVLEAVPSQRTSAGGYETPPAQVIVTDGVSAKIETNSEAPDSAGREIRNYERNNEQASDRAQRITDIIAAFEEVESATAVITGNTAIVGLTLISELGDSDLIELKRRAEAETKRIDKLIDHVAVTTAPGLVKRISEMNGGKTTAEQRELDENIDNELIQNPVPHF